MHLPALLIASLLAAAPAVAATFSVTKAADTADGACDADCSLREAALAANANPGPDEVILPAGAYTLTLDTPGDGTEGTLLLADDGDPSTTTDAVTLRGAGAATTTIEQTLAGRRVIEVREGLAGAVIEDVTLRGGNGVDGTGIIVYAPTTLERVTVTDCHADDGGGVMSFAALTVTDCVFAGNTATDDGGGLMTFDLATVTRSTFRDNAAAGDGGGLVTFEPMVVEGVTFHGNTAGRFGGAIMSFNEVSVVNSTLSDNEAGTAGLGDGAGGAIFTYEPLALVGSTLTANRAEVGGGGIQSYWTPAPLTAPGGGGGLSLGVHLRGALVAGNTPGDCATGTSPIASLGYNLDGDGSCLPTLAAGDQTVADPLLGPLADNGGPTLTHALLAGSPAADAWTDGCPIPATDQRGTTRPQGAACDVGAFEAPPGTSCATTLDFPALLCRLDVVVTETAAATDLAKLQPPLEKLATKARALAVRGQETCAAGSTKSQRKAAGKIAKAGKKLAAYDRKLRTPRAEKQLDAVVRARYSDLVAPLLADLPAFRTEVACPNDA